MQFKPLTIVEFQSGSTEDPISGESYPDFQRKVQVDGVDFRPVGKKIHVRFPDGHVEQGTGMYSFTFVFHGVAVDTHFLLLALVGCDVAVED